MTLQLAGSHYAEKAQIGWHPKYKFCDKKLIWSVWASVVQDTACKHIRGDYFCRPRRETWKKTVTFKATYFGPFETAFNKTLEMFCVRILMLYYSKTTTRKCCRLSRLKGNIKIENLFNTRVSFLDSRLGNNFAVTSSFNDFGRIYSVVNFF